MPLQMALQVPFQRRYSAGPQLRALYRCNAHHCFHVKPTTPSQFQLLLQLYREQFMDHSSTRVDFWRRPACRGCPVDIAVDHVLADRLLEKIGQTNMTQAVLLGRLQTESFKVAVRHTGTRASNNMARNDICIYFSQAKRRKALSLHLNTASVSHLRNGIRSGAKKKRDLDAEGVRKPLGSLVEGSWRAPGPK